MRMPTQALEEFMLSMFEYYALQVEQIAERTYKLGRAGILADAFPGLPSGGFTITFDRRVRWFAKTCSS